MINKKMIKEDLYEAVNQDFLKDLEIPADRSSIGAAAQLDIAIEKLLIDDSKNLDLNDPFVSTEMQHYLKFYRSILNNTGRDLTKQHPVHQMITAIQTINDKKSLNDVLLKLISYNCPTLFGIGVSPSFKDSQLNILYADAPKTILPAKEFYFDDKEKERLLTVFKDVMSRIMTKFNIQNAQQIIKQALELDQKIVEYVKTQEELADYVKMYNPTEYSALLAYSELIDFDAIIKHFIPKEIKQLSVTQPRFYQNITKIYTEDNLDEIKAFILVHFLYDVSDLFDEELRQIKTDYVRALSGAKEVDKLEKFALKKAVDIYSQTVGLYYGQKYFGEEAKKDIYDLVNKIIQQYKKRLAANQWLTSATKDKAILKLDKINVMLAYPDSIPELYKKITYVDNQTLYTNYLENVKLHVLDNLAKYEEKVDPSLWHMPASMVNAYYDPSQNLICFPAAILNQPFYSLKQSRSQNFGGIGAVIAHEISHAFDNNGANFDENGNLNNWWQKEDFAKFQELTNKMITQFDGIEINGGKVNGKLVVSENLADVGGLACAIACAKEEENYNLEELFINYARVWAFKARPELYSLLLKSDVHAPAKLRANIQASNMDEFYEIFDIQQGDKMYRDKKDRIVVW